MTSYSFVPYGGAGEGLYGQMRAAQNARIILTLQPTILNALDKIPISDAGNSLFAIGDYGCGDGAATMPLIGNMIRKVRERACRAVPVMVLYEDQPGNDFNSLIKRTAGLIPDPPTYLEQFPDVYVMASGTGFFKPVAAPGSLDIIVSFAAVHYLSQAGPLYKDSLHRFPNATAEERRQVEALAAADWRHFLSLRAAELKKGGMLYVAMNGYDPSGTHDGVKHGEQGTEEAVLKYWRAMRDEGVITEDEFLNTNMPRCPKTLDECRAPFLANDGGEQNGGEGGKGGEGLVTYAGLELCSAELVKVPYVATEAWREKLERDGVDSTDDWASTVIMMDRSWLNWHFLKPLLASGRPGNEAESIVDELFTRVEKDIKHQGPEKFVNDTLTINVLARKI